MDSVINTANSDISFVPERKIAAPRSKSESKMEK